MSITNITSPSEINSSSSSLSIDQFLEVRHVQRETHQDTADQASDGDGDDPRKKQEANSLPVDSLEGAVAETDADGGASDAHGGRHGEGVLGEDEDGDGGAHFHGGTTRWGVVSKLVAHN